MMSNTKMSFLSTLVEKSAIDRIANIHIDKDIMSSADLRARSNNKETLVYRYYIKLYAMSKMITEEKMAKKSLGSLQLNLESLVDYFDCMVYERDLTDVKVHQKLYNLVSEMMYWFEYLQKKLELHLGSRKERTNTEKDSNFVHPAYVSLNVAKEVSVSETEDESLNIDVPVSVEVEPEILMCEEVCSASSIGPLIFDDYLKAEIILLYFSILNFDWIKLIGFNQFSFKCQRSLDGSILLPEFSGICVTVVVCCLNSGSLPELKFTYGMNFSPGRGVLYNSLDPPRIIDFFQS